MGLYISAALTNAFLSELYGSASEELVLPDAPAATPAHRPEPAPHRRLGALEPA